MNQPTELEVKLKLDKRVAGFLNAVKATAIAADSIATMLSLMPVAQQRFLCQLMAWRIEGGSILPATQGLLHMPQLVGMGWDEIQTTVELLLVAEIVSQVVTKTEKDGKTPKAMGFRYPAFERLLLQSQQRVEGPQLTDLAGRPLK